MKKTLLLGLLFCFFKISYSQQKTIKIFFDKNIYRVDSLKADYYELYIYKDSIKQKGIKKKYSINGRLIYEVEIANLYEYKRPIEDWEYNGRLKTYDNDGIIKSIKTYKMGKLNGPLVTFYKSGKVRRSDAYKDNKYINGKCFSEEGTEIEHFDYEVRPEFEGGNNAMYKIIKKNLRYPINLGENHIGGKVYVMFTVKKNGTIDDILVRAPNKEFKKEVIRVVKLLKNWKPGKRDGVYDDFKFSLPISFETN